MSNFAWQFSYQWNRRRAILPQTQICKFGRTKFDTHTVLSCDEVLISLYILLQVLLSSWHSERKVQLYFPRDLAFHLHVAKNILNNKLFLCELRAKDSVICCRIQQKMHETHRICLWLEHIRSLHIRNPLICYTIQQKIHETHKIWPPSEQDYFFAHFNKRWQYFQGVCENFGNSGGEGG